MTIYNRHKSYRMNLVVAKRQTIPNYLIHIQIFGGSVMQKIQASKIFSTNFEEWDKSRPISFLASSQEHRRGVSA